MTSTVVVVQQLTTSSRCRRVNSIQWDSERITDMEAKEGALEKLKQLMAGEPNFKVREEDDRIFLRYLYYKNFDVNKAFESMKTIYRQKVDYSGWYATERTELQDQILQKEIHTMMPVRDALGRRVYIIKLGNIPVGEYQVYEMSQVDDLWLEAVMDEPETQKNGIVFLIDMKGLSWKFMRYFTPTNCKIGSRKAETIPLHHIQFHIVNSGMLLNTMVSIVFPLLSSATKECNC
ncbi:alpha-tocopherol transfer protein-like isoform X2 [Lycorma delicatula]|uniref:alpha-tocopherol transfer protein-like isoform X2 n=1 Tax=Lycorma delicatula TaxID=130591 RepID=UPI003F50FA87